VKTTMYSACMVTLKVDHPRWVFTIIFYFSFVIQKQQYILN